MMLMVAKFKTDIAVQSSCEPYFSTVAHDFPAASQDSPLSAFLPRFNYLTLGLIVDLLCCSGHFKNFDDDDDDDDSKSL